MNYDDDFTRTMSDREIVKALWKYLVPHKGKFILSFVYMSLAILVDLAPPLLIGTIIDVLSSSDKTVETKVYYVVGFVLAFIIIVIVGLFSSYKQTMLLQEIGQKMILELRSEVYNHIQNLSIGQINEQPVGKFVTRVMNDADGISQMFTSVAVNLIRNIAYMFVTLIILIVISPKLTLITLIVVPLFAIVSYFFRKISRKSYRRIRDEISSLNSFLSENLSGMKITQIFNREEQKRSEFKYRSQRLERNYYKEISIFAIFRPLIYFLSMIGIIAVLYFGTMEVIAGVMTFGLLYSFYSYVEGFFNPIQNIAEEFNNLQNAYASAEKIFSVLNIKPLIIDDEDAIELEEFKGNIEFKNVWFQYIKDEWVLKDVSFKVKPDETVAFVGATGSGKTTILGLIVRNYDIQKGQILIDGIDIKKIKIASLRSHIGQMLQDVFLFNRTITENITLYDDSITKEEVIAGAKYVGADTFIDKLPDQYDHMVLERGNNFSSGQRQLISFARAIVYKPSLMILDEATANIDSETEELIQESLKKMMNISTMLIVAHRLSTIQHSNKIILLDKGEIKEQGNHQELLKQRGMYYNLYKIQFEEKERNKDVKEKSNSKNLEPITN